MDVLMELMDILSVSGNENAVRSYLIKKIKPHCKDIKVDKFGNLIVHKKGKGPSVMLVAHMDEIGLIVKSVSKLGIMHVSMIGSIEPIACINQKVVLVTKSGKKIKGVISTVHLSDGEEQKELPKADDLIVDTGLSKSELQKLEAGIGTFLQFEQKTDTLGSKDIVCGKAADDRVGCYILLELINRIKTSSSEIYFVFTVQEEVGLYGARTSIYNLNPEWSVVVDVTRADDIGEDWHEGTRLLGHGPTLTIMDVELLSNPCLNDNIKAIAKKKKIPLQLEVTDIGTTDALEISLSKGGIPTTVLGVPVRNLHSGVSVVHRKDIENAIKIIEDLLKHPPKICI